MKDSEMTGAQLDAAVAKAEGLTRWIAGIPQTDNEDGGDCLDIDYEPSSRWAHGGPIIEREGIWLTQLPGGEWGADIPGERGNPALNPDPKPGEPGHVKATATGPTPLVAAMRAYVASKLGEQI